MCYYPHIKDEELEVMDTFMAQTVAMVSQMRIYF